MVGFLWIVFFSLVFFFLWVLHSTSQCTRLLLQWIAPNILWQPFEPGAGDPGPWESAGDTAYGL